MTEYQKRFQFARLPLPRHDSAQWRRYQAQFWPPDPAWVSEPVMDPATVRALMAQHMPELLPDFDALVNAWPEVPCAAHLLSGYNTRPWFAGCSQTLGRRGDRTTLMRNYDLGIEEFAGTFQVEQTGDGGWILGAAEAGWGYLDGMNHRGLAGSITFGGRFVVGEGFTVCIVLRYLLQTCGTVDEAVAVLQRLPHRLAQNILLLDARGNSALVYLSPDRGAVIDPEAICCTNHQGKPEVPQHAAFTRTVERCQHMTEAAGALHLQDFLRPPLYNQHYRERFGTLYTVEYDPVAATARFLWPEHELLVTPESPETSITVTLRQP